MRISFLILFVSLAFSSCIDKPNFPVSPKIAYEGIYFVDDNTDSLVVSLHFEDGDGDLGLSAQQINYPFHLYNYYSRITGEELNAKAKGSELNFSEAINYADKRTGAIDTLPPLSPVNGCSNWIIGTLPNGNVDTLYFQRNPTHYNIYVTFLTRDPQGTFEEYDFGCGVVYHGRFPILVDDDKEKAVEGTLTYKIQGAVLGDILDRKIIKLRIYILDRALHVSNVIETEEFILSEIEK